MHTPLQLDELLKPVSRSFYLTLRALPRPVRRPIGLAYLLARATDTMADTSILPPSRRLEALYQLGERIQGRRHDGFDAAEFLPAQSTPGEASLLARLDEVLALLEMCPDHDRQRIRAVLEVIIGGQELDLRRFGSARSDAPQALATELELDDYTYRVAGCVGEFWTLMCLDHLFPGRALNTQFLLENGVRFGKGLQLVNILRDLPTDLRAGRCYLPQSELERVGLEPGDLLNVSASERLRPLYQRYLDLAQAHLAAGWAYTNSLPRSALRVRLACAWPILIGVRTLDRLRDGPVLDASQRVKVTRSEVRQILLGSLVRYPLASAWNDQFRRWAGADRRQLSS